MNLLITSVGRRSYMIEFFKDSLKGIGNVHAANSEKTYATSIADKSIITPPIYDNSYIDFLIYYSKENSITAIISLFDIDLPVLSKNKALFEKNGIRLIISDFKVTELCNDKWLTYNFLLENHISTPLSFIDLEKCLSALQKKEIAFPLIIKPRWGMGSIGVFEAENENELIVLYKKAMQTIENSYLKYESEVDINHSVLIQEKLNGNEYGIDVFNDFNKNYVCSVAKHKIAMRAGETDIAEVIYDAKLDQLGAFLSSKLGHIGNLDVDCFLVNGKFYVLELNCRFGGQYPFSHLAGVNFPKIIIDLLQNKIIDKLDITIQYNTRGFKDLAIRQLNNF